MRNGGGTWHSHSALQPSLSTQIHMSVIHTLYMHVCTCIAYKLHLCFMYMRVLVGQ
jgi:hypothetical protein